MGSRSKRYIEVSKKIDANKVYTLDEGIELIKDSSNLKFDETVDIAVNLNIDPTFSDQNVRGVINLPSGIGKDLRVAVFAKGDKAKEAEESGADIVGSEDLVEKISSGDIDFERCIATPDMMPLVGRLGKVLGPKGLMPNPKLGSVTENLKTAISDAKSGQVEIRNDKDGNIGVSIGKKSFKDEQIIKNYNAILETLEKEKSNNTIKGDLIKSTFISSTMGVSYKLKLAKSI